MKKVARARDRKESRSELGKRRSADAQQPPTYAGDEE
jgi:hypothetical protein